MSSNEPSIDEEVNDEEVSGTGDAKDNSQSGSDSESRSNDESSSNTDIENQEKSPLHCAVEEGNIEMVKELLKIGCNPNVTNEKKASALFIAFINGNMQIINLLLQYGANIGEALIWAIKDENADVFKKILEFGVNSNKVEHNQSYGTHIMLAIERENLQIVQLLLQYGADPNYIDIIGKSPIHEAVIFNYIEITKELLKHGAEVDRESIIEMTPLMHALYEKMFEIAKICLEHGANINHQCSKDGRTALHVASNTGKLETIEFLLKHGANIDAIDDENCTPLHLAARKEFPWTENDSLLREQPEAVKILLKNGANPNLQDMHSKTGLYYAVRGRNFQIIRLYLEYATNLDLSIRDKDGKTVFEYALSWKNVYFVKMMAFHQNTV